MSWNAWTSKAKNAWASSGIGQKIRDDMDGTSQLVHDQERAKEETERLIRQKRENAVRLQNEQLAAEEAEKVAKDRAKKKRIQKSKRDAFMSRAEKAAKAMNMGLVTFIGEQKIENDYFDSYQIDPDTPSDEAEKYFVEAYEEWEKNVKRQSCDEQERQGLLNRQKMSQFYDPKQKTYIDVDEVAKCERMKEVMKTGDDTIQNKSVNKINIQMRAYADRRKAEKKKQQEEEEARIAEAAELEKQREIEKKAATKLTTMWKKHSANPATIQKREEAKRVAAEEAKRVAEEEAKRVAAEEEARAKKEAEEEKRKQLAMAAEAEARAEEAKAKENRAWVERKEKEIELEKAHAENAKALKEINEENMRVAKIEAASARLAEQDQKNNLMIAGGVFIVALVLFGYFSSGKAKQTKRQSRTFRRKKVSRRR